MSSNLFGANSSRTFKARSKNTTKRLNLSNNRSVLKLRDTSLIEIKPKIKRKPRRPRTKNESLFDEVFKMDDSNKENDSKEESLEDSLMSSKYWKKASPLKSNSPQKSPLKSSPFKENSLKRKADSSSSEDEGPSEECKIIPRRPRGQPLKMVQNQITQKSRSHLASTPCRFEKPFKLNQSGIGIPMNHFNETAESFSATPLKEMQNSFSEFTNKSTESHSPIKKIVEFSVESLEDVSSINITAEILAPDSIFPTPQFLLNENLENVEPVKSDKISSIKSVDNLQPITTLNQTAEEVLKSLKSCNLVLHKVQNPEKVSKNVTNKDVTKSPPNKTFEIDKSVENNQNLNDAAKKSEKVKPLESDDVSSKKSAENKTALDSITNCDVLINKTQIPEKLVENVTRNIEKPVRRERKTMAKKVPENNPVQRRRSVRISSKNEIENIKPLGLVLPKKFNLKELITPITRETKSACPPEITVNEPNSAETVSKTLVVPKIKPARRTRIIPDGFKGIESIAGTSKARKSAQILAESPALTKHITPRSKSRLKRLKKPNFDPVLDTPSKRRKSKANFSIIQNVPMPSGRVEIEPKIVQKIPRRDRTNLLKTAVGSKMRSKKARSKDVVNISRNTSVANNSRMNLSRANSSDAFDAEIDFSPIQNKKFSPRSPIGPTDGKIASKVPKFDPIPMPNDFKTPVFAGNRRKTTAIARSKNSRRTFIRPGERSILQRSILENTCALNRKRVSTAFFLKNIQDKIVPGVEGNESVEFLSTENREYALEKLGQKKPLTLNQFLTSSKLKVTKKVGEGVFGEVFVASGDKETLILKVIPVDGTIQINSSPQKPIREVIGEFLISKTLKEHNLEGFCIVKKAVLCNGVYPKSLKTAWTDFTKTRESENDEPWSILPKEQLYIVLQMAHCGDDLDSQNLTAEEAKFVLKEVSKNLAAAETACQFEHRDLHAGNILISRDENGSVIPTMIDFTLSRATSGEEVIFADLEYDHEIFEGDGDPQFDVYRMMQKSVKKEWKPFQPKTNVYWIAFLAGWLGRNVPKNSKTQKKLLNFSRTLKVYKNSTDIVKRLDLALS